MLPANLAKTRTAGRGTYGEFVVLSGGPSSGSLGASVGQPSTVRYAPYPLPATITTAGHQQAATTHILSPLSHHNPHSIVQFTAPALGATSNLYDTAATAQAVSYKRLLAATAAASLRSHHPTQTNTHTSHHHHHHPHHRSTLSYPLGDLLGVQGLDFPGIYQIPSAAAMASFGL